MNVTFFEKYIFPNLFKKSRKVYAEVKIHISLQINIHIMQILQK